MADLIIKPNSATGDKLILQDRAGGAVITTADSGATLADGIALGTPASGVLTNATFPTGHVIQTIYAQDNNPASTISTTSASWVTSGLSVQITGLASSSKVLVMFDSGVGYAGGESHRQFYRGSTALGAGAYGFAVIGAVGGFIPWGLTWVDTGHGGGTHTYTVYHKSDNTSITSYITWAGAYWNFIAMEIAA